MATYKRSTACCTTPAIIGPPYTAQGNFINTNGMNVYTAGPSGATKAIFIIYDIFGYSSQILLGADKLAEKYRIFMPDFFDGKPAPMAWMPMDGGTPDEGKMDEFCDGPGETRKTLRKMEELLMAFQDMYPEIISWGLVGYCWGGYIVNFALDKHSRFTAAVQCHAGWPGVEIAETVSRPLLALNSMDEPEAEYQAFQKALRVRNRFVDFPAMVHGWLSARGDLGKGEVRVEFERGYGMMLEWFGEYLDDSPGAGEAASGRA